MKIDGREYSTEQLAIIAVPGSMAKHKPGTACMARPCELCGLLLRIEAEQAGLIANGARVVCIWCAVEQWPNMIAGRDPETGELLTLGQMAERPNLIGGYHKEDVTEV